MKKLVALLLALAMVLSLAACGGSSESAAAAASGSEAGSEGTTAAASGNEITDLVNYELASNELETLNILYSQNASDLRVIANLQDALLTNDSDGQLIPCLAESWETTDGGLTWTFHLRQDAVWVDMNGNEMAKLTSADFVTGMEWVLNSAKNLAANTSMLIELVEGAGDYYEYTNGLDAAEAEALAPDNETFLGMVGIETPDDYTVVYHCAYAAPYFDTLATYSPLYPAPAALIEQLGVNDFRSYDNTTMWYSGPYVLTEYINGNEKIYEQNPLWWGADQFKRFNSVTTKMVDSNDVAYQLYQTGEIDHVTLSESTINIINDNENDQFHDYLVETRPDKYSFQIHFVYDKYNEDGTKDDNWNMAVSNEAFRLAWYYGLDLTSYLGRTNAINPLKCENNYYTMTGVAFMSDGRDYTELVKERLGLGDYNGTSMVRLDTAKAEEYKQQAIEELTALGVTFPVECAYYISAASQTELDTANVLAQCISDSLGDDFVTLKIDTYVSSLAQEVRNPKLASIYTNGWGADYGDPQNFLVQETYGNDNAYYSVNYSCIEDFYGPDGDEPYSEELIAVYEEFTRLVNEANAITDDTDARYEAYADAEAYMIQHALIVPTNYRIQWQLTKINDYTKCNAPYGIQFYRFIDWETNADGYTTAEYEAIAAAAG